MHKKLLISHHRPYVNVIFSLFVFLRHTIIDWLSMAMMQLFVSHRHSIYDRLLSPAILTQQLLLNNEFADKINDATTEQSWCFVCFINDFAIRTNICHILVIIYWDCEFWQ